MPKAFTTESARVAREAINIQKSRYVNEHLGDLWWKTLSNKYAVKLPPWFTRPSDGAVKAVLLKTGLPWITYVGTYGWDSAANFEEENPTFGMRVLTGLILELADAYRKMQLTKIHIAHDSDVVLGLSKTPVNTIPRGVSKAKRKPLKVL